MTYIRTKICYSLKRVWLECFLFCFLFIFLVNGSIVSQIFEQNQTRRDVLFSFWRQTNLVRLLKRKKKMIVSIANMLCATKHLAWYFVHDILRWYILRSVSTCNVFPLPITWRGETSLERFKTAPRTRVSTRISFNKIKTKLQNTYPWETWTIFLYEWKETAKKSIRRRLRLGLVVVRNRIG